MRTIWDSSHYRQQRLSDLDFADIIALIDDPEVKLQNGPSQLEQKGGKVGLTANAKTTKVNMPISKEPTPLTINIGNDATLETVEKFVYLGGTMAHNGVLSSELNYCIQRNAAAFNRLLLVLTNSHVSINTKAKLF